MNQILENISIAISAIRMNLLRSILTIFIIGFGIMSLISMLTAIDGIKGALFNDFARVGSNTFTIDRNDLFSQMQRRGRSSKTNRPISFKEAAEFKNRFQSKGTVSINYVASDAAVVQFQSTKTAPKIKVIGIDENGLETSGLDLAGGRNFTGQEVTSGRRIAIIGNSLKQDLFGDRDPLGKIISLSGQHYLICAWLEKKGSSFGSGQDNEVRIPVIAARNDFGADEVSFKIDVRVPEIKNLDEAIGDATGIFRTIRMLDIPEENDFFITKSDSLAEILIQNLSALRIIAFAIGLITLLGAAVGLTNIMMVSVTERTREIGIRKAIGANTVNIRNQFLWEAVVICQAGGLLGIILGLGLGNVAAHYMNAGFIIPWNWILFGLILCFITGIFAGLYPANKAARLNPIESLRHE